MEKLTPPHKNPFSSKRKGWSEVEKKYCELCNSLATIYCDSDQAILCLECDSKVHSANKLVYKHTRVLLCNFCQSLTPWSGSGPKLTRTITCCEDCQSNGDNDTDDEDSQVVPCVVLNCSSSNSTTSKSSNPLKMASTSFVLGD